MVNPSDNKLPPQVPKTNRSLVNLNALPASNTPSDVTAIIGYTFDPGDVRFPITPELLEVARQTVRKAASEGGEPGEKGRCHRIADYSHLLTSHGEVLIMRLHERSAHLAR